MFEELAIENLAVLDDMGKSMVLRRVSSGVRGNLHLFGGHLDKAGFISEIKSMLSEFFQYGITEEKLETLIGETKSPLLRQKLLDMQVLYRAFQAYTEEKVIVKEEILSLLCRVLPQSQLIRDSVVTLDGYTGFTPIPVLPEGDRDGHDGSGGQPVPRERAAEALLHEPSYRLPCD